MELSKDDLGLRPDEEEVMTRWTGKSEVAIDNVVALMRSCPYESQVERVTSILGILDQITRDDRVMALIAATAIERLSPPRQARDE